MWSGWRRAGRPGWCASATVPSCPRTRSSSRPGCPTVRCARPGPASSGTDVYIVGGANSAGQAALFFARHARSVTLVVRGDSLERSMSYYLIQQLAGTENIQVCTGTEVVHAHGEDHLVDGRRPVGWDRDRDPFYLESSVPGIFAAGDVRANSVKRVASAVGEGAMAV